jgi:hypothetical protein
MVHNPNKNFSERIVPEVIGPPSSVLPLALPLNLKLNELEEADEELAEDY